MLPSNKFNRDEHVFRSPAIIKVVENATNFLIKSPAHILPPQVSFQGVGVYAIYYIGNFALYSRIAALNQRGYKQPIYVGKAVPPGWRQGRKTDVSANSLYGRLNEHAQSLDAAENLELNDFVCRFIIMEGQESNLISTVESALVRRFTPLWNSIIGGFGNHDPGKGRYKQSPSEWDTLHPGRLWATRLQGESPSTKLIVAKIRTATASL